MIRKLTRVKGLGIFRDYKWDSSLHDFCRYNLIYGWNGAGKTTLAKLFGSLEAGGLDKYPQLQYEIATESRTWKQGSHCSERVRVFNRDYVSANIDRVDGPRPIFVLGAENAELVKQIDQDDRTLKSKQEELGRLQSERDNLTKRKNKLFTDVARTISQNTAGESTRVYRRPNAESDFGELTSKQLQTADSLATLKATLNQQQKPQLDALPENADLGAEVKAICDEASALLKQTVSSEVIKRLADHPDIARWVEEGISLHATHSSMQCEFCAQNIPDSRQQALAAHFNDADRALKRSVDELRGRLSDISTRLDGLRVREASNLYDELADEYQRSSDRFASARDALRTDLHGLGDRVAEKKSHTTEQLTISITPDPKELVDAIAALNAQLKKHNSKSKDFDNQAAVARGTLKEHYLSEIYDDVEDLQGDIDSADAAIKMVLKGNPANADDHGIEELAKRLSDARAKVSSSHAACKEINEKLALFLGRDELAFEVSGDGYQITRSGEVADDLSESERTAIAFVYFVVHLSDQEFSLEDGIVVIDDPVSSLDANSLFQAFAFLKESVANAKQVFILTHNFEFMRLVKNWLFHTKKAQRSFYMVNNRESNGKREAYLAPLDKLLMEFQSEYHYLFSLLRAFNDDGSLESIYNFPNIGRKFLETFLAFKVPSHENLNQKIGHLDYDETKKTAILRFVQTHSHAVRSDGVLNFDMSISRGGQTAIQNLLDMIETVDPTHYGTLVATVERGQS